MVEIASVFIISYSGGWARFKLSENLIKNAIILHWDFSCCSCINFIKHSFGFIFSLSIIILFFLFGIQGSHWNWYLSRLMRIRGDLQKGTFLPRDNPFSLLNDISNRNRMFDSHFPSFAMNRFFTVVIIDSTIISHTPNRGMIMTLAMPCLLFI